MSRFGDQLAEIYAAQRAQAEEIVARKKAEDQAVWDPYTRFGENALRDVESLSADPSLVTKLPGYQFRLGQGIDRRKNDAAAAGGLLSGNALRGVEEYGQDYASDEYDKEFKRRMGKVGIGLSATGGKSGVSMNYLNALTAYDNRQRPETDDGSSPWQLLAAGAGAAGGLGWRPFT